MGIGFLTNQLVAGLFIGLGAGFVGNGYSKSRKKEINHNLKTHLSV